jgi:hypothetical protein
MNDERAAEIRALADKIANIAGKEEADADTPKPKLEVKNHRWTVTRVAKALAPKE